VDKVDKAITIAFLVEWSASSRDDLFACLRYVERAIEVAKNKRSIGHIRVIVADRDRGRSDHATQEQLEAHVPLAAQIEVVSCALETICSAFNRMSMRTAEQFFFLTNAGAVLSPTSLDELLEIATVHEASVVCGRRLPVEIPRNLPAGAHPDIGYCSLIRAAAFHALSGFDAAHFGAELFGIDFCWRAKALGLNTHFEPAATYFYEADSEGDGASDAHLLEFATLLRLWGAPSEVQDFIDLCVSRGRASAVSNFQKLWRANRLPQPRGLEDGATALSALSPFASYQAD
jgi:hypothetical protein